MKKKYDAKLSMPGERIWDIALGLAFLFIFLFILYHPLRANHDVAQGINFGQLLLDGKLPYVDFVDINPPLIMYISLIPALVARILPIHAILANSLMLLALSIWSALAVRNMILISDNDFDRKELGLVLLAWIIFSFFLGSHFGQREHIFMLMSFPFLISRWIKWEGKEVRRSTMVITALMSAVGACLKPHFIFVLLATEIYWSISKRNIRNFIQPEVFAFIAVCLAYGGHFFLWPDAVREAYFQRWVPFFIQRYQTYNVTFSYKHYAVAAAISMVAWLPFILKLPVRGNSFQSLERSLTVFTMASLAIYFGQHKGWIYQLIPAIYGTMLIYVITFAGIVFAPAQASIAMGKARVRGLILGLTLAGMAMVFFSRKFLWKDPASTSTIENSPLVKVISNYSREGDPILVITTDVATAYPLLLQMNRKPGTRYLPAFALAMFYYQDKINADGEFPYHAGGTASADEIRFLDELAEDVAKGKPPLIFITDGNDTGCPKGFSIMQYLAKMGFIEKAMKDYTLLSTPQTNGTISTNHKVAVFISNTVIRAPA